MMPCIDRGTLASALVEGVAVHSLQYIITLIFISIRVQTSTDGTVADLYDNCTHITFTQRES